MFKNLVGLLSWARPKINKKTFVAIEEKAPDEIEKRESFFSGQTDGLESNRKLTKALADTFKLTADNFRPVDNKMALDSITGATSTPQFNPYAMPPAQMLWYASQSFIGYQLCAMLAQNWLVGKACAMPGKDALRHGWEITVNDGTEVPPDIIAHVRKMDVRYRLAKNLFNFVKFGRVFGIRIALFNVESSDPEYYFKPFNIDGVTPGSYKGITQVDPYWITPELDDEASADPSSMHFYEPTWWRINGNRYHRTHLIIMRTEEVADVLKPTYFYGGMPVPQKIYDRVYAAERTANEAPELALTKRAVVLQTDIAAALANQVAFEKKMILWREFLSNYGVKVIDKEAEQIQQFDTSLADLDAVIMTQYQLVASAANVPSVKLLGTSPKGFNTTGEFEESNYHEELESIQTHDLTPFLDRHYLLLVRSEIMPQYNVGPFELTIVWRPLDTMTGTELATLNKLKADTGQVLVSTGAIDGNDERQRVINDPSSGYNGLTEEPEADFEDDETPVA